ncbi:MAG: hypothetical protein HFJ34_03455 [Clostridia bacterium]|nr:hypothetical protein [Clostridia bacterium]
MIITIIVLLILATISILTLTGDNGILSNASKAKEETLLAEIKEKVNLMLADYQIEKMDHQELELLEYFKEKKAKEEIDDVIENQEGNIEVTIDGYIVIIAQDNLTIIDIRNADYMIGTYRIKGYNQEKNVIEIAVIFKSDTNIKTVICPNNETKTYSEKEIEVDYEVIDGKRYEFIVETENKRLKYRIQTKGTTVGNKVNSKETLEEVAQLVNLGCNYENKTITMGTNIDLKGSEDSQWIPIGNETNKFKGTFDGSNKIITNLYINSNENNQALFGANSGTIKNITIADSTIKSTKGYTAGIVAYNDTTGIVENVHNQSCNIIVDSSTGAMSDTIAGGICAVNYGVVKKCSNNADISCNTKGVPHNSCAGGIVGSAIDINQCEILECYNTGDITATSDSRCGYSGGIIGMSGIEKLWIKNCYNTGKIVSKGISGGVFFYKYSSSGGIVGYIDKNLECSYCYNIGKIEAQQDYGGILGCDGRNNGHGGGTLAQFTNLYYLDTSADYIVGNSNHDETGKLSENSMKGNVLLDNLNDNWTQSKDLNDGYPVLSWQVKE